MLRVPTLERIAFQRFHERRLFRRNRQPGQFARRRQRHLRFGDPAAGFQVGRGIADGDVVADHRVAPGNVAQRHFVALRHRFQQRETVREHGARL
jgi:hypothetical protein